MTQINDDPVSWLADDTETVKFCRGCNKYWEFGHHGDVFHPKFKTPPKHIRTTICPDCYPGGVYTSEIVIGVFRCPDCKRYWVTYEGKNEEIGWTHIRLPLDRMPDKKECPSCEDSGGIYLK